MIDNAPQYDDRQHVSPWKMCTLESRRRRVRSELRTSATVLVRHKARRPSLEPLLREHVSVGVEGEVDPLRIAPDDRQEDGCDGHKLDGYVPGRWRRRSRGVACCRPTRSLALATTPDVGARG